MNASPPASGIGRHSPAKQNQSSPALVNLHFDFGGFVPVNSKKCEAGIRQRPFLICIPRVGWSLRLNLVQTADALTGAAAGPLAVSALSISSIVRPRVSKPMNRTATSARTYQAAK